MTKRDILERQRFNNPVTGRRLKSTATITKLIKKGTFRVPQGLVISPHNRLVLDTSRTRRKYEALGFELDNSRRYNPPRIIRNYTVTKDDDSFKLFDIIKNNNIYGVQTVVYIVNGEQRTTNVYNIPRNNLSRWYKEIVQMDWMVNSDLSVFNTEGDGVLLIAEGQRPIPENVIQQFASAEDNQCLLKPILEYFRKRYDGTNITSKKRKFLAIINLTKKFINTYPEGVPEDKIKYICNTLHIGIDIIDAMSNKIISEDCVGKRYTRFNFINTNINHVEQFTNHSKNCRVEISQKKYYKLRDYFTKKGIWHTWNEYSISTLDAYYILKQDTEITHWEESQGLDSMEYFHNPDLSEYMISAVHFSGFQNFKKNPLDSLDLKYIDHEKSYANYKSCEFYEGFMRHPNEFRKLPDNFPWEKYPGVYTIFDVDISNVNIFIKPFIERMALYIDNEIFPSPELKFLKSLNIKFRVIAGAWSFQSRDIDMKDLIEGKKYCYWTGKAAMVNKYHTIRFNGTAEEANLYEYRNPGCVNYFPGLNEIQISVNKNICYHKSHISSWILSYSRIQILQQLFTIPFNKVTRIALDGIYHTQDNVTLINNFRDKTHEINRDKLCRHSNEYYSTHVPDIEINIPEWEDHAMHQHVLALGPGGSGKTHHFLHNKPMTCLSAFPSHKLRKEKEKEHNLKYTCCWAKLLARNTSPVTCPTHCILIDEVSMMSEEEKKKIIKLYPYSKLIFAGDVGYQLPTFEGNQEFQIDNSLYILRFNTNYRCKDPELLELLTYCRDSINSDDMHLKVREIIPRGNKNNYQILDFIMAHTHKECDDLNEYFKNIRPNKWRIQQGTSEHDRGDILYQSQCPNGGKLAHCLTAHSCQGITVTTKLFIKLDMAYRPNNRMIYTVLSRAQYLNQLYLI